MVGLGLGLGYGSYGGIGTWDQTHRGIGGWAAFWMEWDGSFRFTL